MTSSSERILDELLARRCRRGDADAWRALVGRYEKRLLYFVRRLVDDERDAYDVLQQTWMSAVTGITTLAEPRALRTWLYRIARNEAINHLRRQGRRIEAIDSPALEAVADDSIDDDEWSAEAAEQVHAAMRKLSLPHREVLTLHFLEDASVEEIAAVLEVPPGTVKSRLHYARAALRGELERREVR
ncbi:MAG: sigma-70 family RNA polymerase sigma factor [Tepidisphaeraceae bacterium]